MSVQEEPSFPLLDVPDADLDEDGLKEKRKQRLLKAGYDARVRARKEKDREREERAEAERAEVEERGRNHSGWANRLRQEQEVRFFPTVHCFLPYSRPCLLPTYPHAAPRQASADTVTGHYGPHQGPRAPARGAR
jgi:actin-related protein